MNSHIWNVYLKGGIAGFIPLSCLFFLSGCSSLSYSIQPPQVPHSSGHYIDRVPTVAQKEYQCGPAALESVARYWGKEIEADKIAKSLYKIGTKGVFNFMLVQYAKNLGFWTQTAGSNIDELKVWILRDIPPIVMLRVGPSVLGISNYHFVVLKGLDDEAKIFYANVGESETHAISYQKFQKRWNSARHWSLVVCPLERVDWNLESDQASDLGLLLEQSGQLDPAEKWYRYSLDRDPENGIVLFNLANVYLKKKRWDEAETIYLKLLREKPDAGPLSNNLAWIYLEKGRYQEAIDVIEKAFKNGAERQYDILDTLALAYCKSGEFKKAQECFQEALNKIPSSHQRPLQLIKDHSDHCGS
jgi:tetratricopeptide (TPR) repeat protein